jgi:hypothetical protein
MHWQKGGCELCSPVRVATSAELLRTSGFDRQRTGLAAVYSSGFCVEVSLFLETHT